MGHQYQEAEKVRYPHRNLVNEYRHNRILNPWKTREAKYASEMKQVKTNGKHHCSGETRRKLLEVYINHLMINHFHAIELDIGLNRSLGFGTRAGNEKTKYDVASSAVFRLQNISRPTVLLSGVLTQGPDWGLGMDKPSLFDLLSAQ